MQSATTQTSHGIKISRIIMLIGVVIVLGVAVFFVGKKMLTSVPTSSSTQTQVAEPEANLPSAVMREEIMKISRVDSAVAKVGSPFVVRVDANSKGSDIIGYDVVLKYDPTVLEFVSVNSMVSDFQIFNRVGTDNVSVTGTKAVQAKQKTVFNGTGIVSFTFKPKKATTTEISLQGIHGKLKSKLVDVAVKSLISADDVLSVMVGK